MVMDVLLGIDIGSTSIRCCVFDMKAKLLKQASRPTENVHISTAKFGSTTRAWDASLLWKEVTEILREINPFLDHHHLFPRGIACSCVGCSPVILDKYGKPLFPVFRHFSSESKLLEKQKEQTGARQYRQITGYPLASTSTGFVLASLKDSNISSYSRIASILPVSSYIAFKLSGERTSDLSVAASFGLWNHRECSWWGELLSFLNISPEIFGRIVNGGDFIGDVGNDVMKITGLRSGLPVFAGGHDYLCAALAASCYQPGMLFNIEGTFEIVATFHSSPITIPAATNTRSITDIHVVPGIYSLMVERIGAGQVEWLKSLFYPQFEDPNLENNWETIIGEIDQISDNEPGPEVVIPHIFGMLFPRLDDAARGALLGISPKTTRASIIKSAIIASCFESRQMFDYQKSLSVLDLNQVITVGGATKSTFWMQQKADITGVEITVPRIEEPSALGAALLAGKGSGLYTDFNQIEKVTSSLSRDVFRPEASQSEKYTDFYQQVYLPVLTHMKSIDEIITAGMLRRRKK
jgi:xylulokinase